MDDFSYHYEEIAEDANKFKRNTNRLSYVTDAVAAGNYTEDIDNQNSDNYAYDGIGNLIKDEAEEIKEIQWHVNGKVKSVERTATSNKSDLEFYYDAMGQRCIKLEKPRSGGALTDESDRGDTHRVFPIFI